MINLPLFSLLKLMMIVDSPLLKRGKIKLNILLLRRWTLFYCFYSSLKTNKTYEVRWTGIRRCLS